MNERRRNYPGTPEPPGYKPPVYNTQIPAPVPPKAPVPDSSGWFLALVKCVAMLILTVFVFTHFGVAGMFLAFLVPWIFESDDKQ